MKKFLVTLCIFGLVIMPAISEETNVENNEIEITNSISELIEETPKIIEEIQSSEELITLEIIEENKAEETVVTEEEEEEEKQEQQSIEEENTIEEINEEEVKTEKEVEEIEEVNEEVVEEEENEETEETEEVVEEVNEEEEEVNEEATTIKQVFIKSSARSCMTRGEPVYLTSYLTGFEGCEIYYQWQCDKGNGFQDIPGANSDSYTFSANKETLSWGWRLTVYYRDNT